MKKLLLFLLSFLLVHNIFSQDVPFTQRLNPNTTVKGDITFIANNILNRDSRKTPNLAKKDPNTDLYSAYTGNEGANTAYYSDLFRTTNGISGFPLGNGNLYMDYIDIDNDNTTFSSSKSSLNLPPCSYVTYAGLYWSAIYPYETWDNETPRANDFNNIKFKLPGQGYQDITGEIIYDNGVTTQKPYLCYKDITSNLSALSNPNGDYYAANIKATLGIDANNGVGGTAGWVLVIIYENETESSKNISIFDGFTTVDGVHDTEISLSGFSTIPSGPVRAKVLTASLEGDTFITGDNFQIKNNVGNYVNLSTSTINQTNNFFNSSITQYDNYVTSRTPKGENTLGFDVDLFELDNGSNSIITNNQTSVDARFTTTGDSYWPFLTAIAIEINEPEIQLVETTDDNSGNNLQFVSLGNDVWYNISFQSTGSDDATNTVITKKLPNNINLIPEDLVIPVGVTYTYVPPSVSNSFRGELEFTIPDNLVKKNGAIYNIRLHTQITSDCNDFKDSCSNIIESQSFANYEGIQSLIQIDNKPSSSGIDACGFNIIGASNILVDTSSCSSITEVQLCGSSIDLTAGNGFASYEWKDSAGTTIGNTQTITVTTTDTYTVNKINSGTTSAACVPFTETYNVTSFGSGTNPILAFADETLTCTSDSSLQLANFYLCGDSDSRTINTGITAPTTVKWQQLNSPSNPIPNSSCPDVTGTWVDVTSNTNSPTRNFSNAGQYRLVLEGSGGCFERYYFNIYKETINPTIVNQDIIASTPGSITINNVPSGYEYALVAAGTPAGITYQTSNVFPISIAGDYDVYIKNVSTNCVYQYLSQSIKATNIDVTINTTPILCSGDVGQINVQINNPTSGIYNYRILSGTSLISSFGPTTDRSRNFSIANSGTYTIEITGVDNSYSFIEDFTFSSPQALEITTSTTKEINCTDGVISLSTGGGTPSYNYALWSYTPAITATKTPISYVNIADISPSNFFTDANYSITSGEEGIYEFVVLDNNNCTKISSPVTITLEEPLQFTEAHTDVTCSDNGTIIVNTVTPPGLMGYILEYSLDGGVYVNSNSFSVEAGNHIVDIRATKNGFSCNYSTGTITINSSTVLTGGSVVATNLSCNPSSNVNLGSITFTQPTGGVEPYTYLYKNSSNASFLRTTNTTITDLSSGTYDVQIEDANGCVLILPSVTIDPLPTRPILNSTVLYNCDGTGNITILSNNPNYTYTLENTFTSNNTGIFNNLSSGTYTINIDYGSSCFEKIIVEVLDNQEFSSSIISSSNTSCNGGTDGQITITSKNFLTTYDYSIDGGTNWINTTSTPLTITGLSVGEYTIITRPFDGNNSCEFAVGNVTIEELETVSISNVNITKEVTCAPNTGATINIIATGGVSPYQFSIDNGNTFQSDPSFTNLAAGTYNLIARDVNDCISSYFTYIVEPSALVSFTTTGTTCYDGTNGAINVDVSSGSGGYSFSLNGGAWLFPSSLTATSYTFEGIASGTHTIAVRDNSGCISPSTTTTINPELTATATVENNFGLDDVTIIVQGGNPPYAYSTNGGLNYQPSNSFTGLTPNSYNLLVRDSNGCVTNISTNTECDQFDFRVRLIKEISCIDPDAEVELSILSGSGSYEYEVFDSSGAVIVSRTPIINTTINFPVSFSGTYTVKGYDIGNSSECSLSKNITINPVIIPEFTVSSTDATCNGSATGTINVLTNAGTPPFNYDLTTLGNSTTGIWNASSNSFTNVPAGTYTVRVTGSNGCSTETNIIVNDNPYLIVPSLTSTPFSCVTANNTDYATLSIDASLITGGSGVYSILDLYNDNGSAGDLNDDIKITESLINGNIHTFNIIDTNGGNYYLKVVDSNGCESFSNTVTIDPFDELLIITSVQNESISCTNGGELIDINFTSRIGTTGLIATISDSSGIIETITNIDSGVSITNTTRLPVGVYTIRITHPITGCELSTIYEVKGLPNYIINTNVVANVSCFRSSTGEINIDFDSSTPYTGTYTYEILEVATRTTTGITGTGVGNTNNTITGLSAGEYYVEATMTSFPFCTIITPNIVISEPVSPLSLSESISAISCIGGNDGSVNLIATGGWGGYDYKIAPSFGAGAGSSPEIAFNTNNTFENLSSGNYIITVRDINGCEESNEITIIEPTQITATASLTQDYTCSQNGTITFTTPTGGTPPYSYGINNVYSSDLIKDNLSSGTYELSIRDNNNCEINLNTVTIDPLSLENTLNSNVSYNCDGTGNITISPVNSNYTYTLSGEASQSSNLFTNLPSGEHVITVNDNTCFVDLTITVESNKEFNASVMNSNNASCNGENDGSITINVNNFGNSYNYTIDGGQTWIDSTLNTTTIEGLAKGTYPIIIQSSSGCEIILPSTSIEEPEILLISDIKITKEATCSPNTGATIKIIVTGGIPPYEFSIDEGNTWQQSNIYTNLPAATYDVLVRDNSNCLKGECSTSRFTNGNFDNVPSEISTFRIVNEDNFDGWKTTSTDNNIEIWKSGYNGITSSSGDYFVELNANTPGSLYQEFCTNPGDVISWSLDHRGRLGIDNAEIRIGASLTPSSSDNIQTLSDGLAWGTYSGSYIVPDGQLNTIISFEAIASSTGNLSLGNFIDNINIEIHQNNNYINNEVTINAPSDLIGAFNQFTSDGIELTATGGNPPYEYSIDRVNFVTTSTFSNLIPNTYNPVIRDANGCLTNLPEITTTSSLVGAFTEFTTGGIELTATGGTPPYEYSIDGIVFVDTTTFTNLPSGTYTPVIKDSVGSIFNFLPIDISNDELPIASNDTGTYISGTQSTPINVTTNDTTGSTVDPSTIRFVSGGVLTSGGKTLTVIGEGIWSVNSFGEVIFSPESGFIGNPTPIDYTIENTEGYISNTATITLISSSLIITANDDSFNVTPITTGETITPSVLDNDTLNGIPVVIGSNSGEISLSPSPTGITNPTGLTLDFITGEITVSSNTLPGSYIYTYEICENGANPTNCDIAEVTILVNDTSFNLDILPENVTCFGNSDGKIQVYINGGTPPYTCKVLDMENNPLYTKTGDNRPFTFSNMPAGEYIIEVTDSNNITDTFSSAIISQPVNNLAQSTVITNPACNGESSGQINATATGGWGGYQYQLDDRLTGVVIATYSSNNHFTNLTAGDYTLSVKDLNGCTVFSTITIEEPTVLVGIANLTSSNTITISSVTGGQPPYQYSIDGGTTFTTSPIFSDLDNGTYTSIIKDANDCTTNLSSIVISSNEFPNLSDDSITATQNTSIVINMYTNDTNIPTNGSLTTDTPTNGTVIINDPNGTPNDPSDDVLTYIPDMDFNGTDTFTYTICDTNIPSNCDTATVVIIVESLEPLLITGISITDFSCEVADAIAVVNVIGGTPPYNYELSNDITGAILLNSTNNIFSNLPEGNYSVKVTDSNNNLDISQFAINTPISLEITAANSIINCDGENNGEIIVTSTGGNPPYSYTLNGSSLQTENIFTNLSPGTYSIDVQDVNNCTASTIITLDTPSPIISNTEIIGNTATISTTGGTPPYEYSIDAGNTFTTSSTFSNLNEGAYDVVVRDHNGCFEIFPFSIAINPIAVIDFITTIQNTSVIIPILTNDINISQHDLLTFNQSSNGSISLDDSGTPNDISDDILIYTPNNNFIGTDEFIYTLCDVNFTNCSTASVTINVKSNSFSIDVITNDATCASNNNGIIEVNVNGGTPPYNFELMDTGTNTITSRTSNIFTRLLAGEYIIKVTDSNNVFETLQGIIINEPPLLTTTLTANQISCNGSADGSITIDATGGSGSYVYEINTVPGRFQSENTFTNLIPGFYEVTIQDENGCFKIMQAEINEPSVVTITLVETTSSGNQPSGFISIEATGGLPPYSYSIDGNNFISSNEFLDLASGTYNLSAQDSNGCNSLNLTVTLNQIDIDNSVMQESDELEATYKNATSYQWINVDTKTRIPGATSSSFKPSESGRYQVEMTISESATRTVVNNKTVINNKTVSQVVLSPIVEFNIDTLSTEDIEENNFKVYPNPTTEFINLPSELLGEDYKIYTILGREVDHGKIESTKLLVESLSEGIYFLKIKRYTPVKFIKK